jgi:hypothetical protein
MENIIDEFAERIRREMTISTEEYERRKAEYIAIPVKRGRKLGSGIPKEYKKHSTSIKKILQAEKRVYSYDDIRLSYKMGKEDSDIEYKEKLKGLEERIKKLEATFSSPSLKAGVSEGDE